MSVKPLEIANLLPSHKEQQASEDNTLETEWKIISKVINLSTCWLVNIFGSCSENFIAKVINYEDFELKNTQGMDTFGIFCYFDSCLLNEYLTRLIVSEDFVEVYNKCLELVHNEIDMMRGEIYSLMPCEYIFCWQFNDDEILNEAIGVEGDALADLRASYSTAKAELAFTAITSALFKLRVYLRNYTYRAHDELDFVFENLVKFSMHSGWAIKGPVGGEQKVDLTLISQTIQTTIRLAKYATKFNVDFVMSDQVRNILSKKVVSCDFRP